MNNAKTILLCGVGGQGTILAAKLLAQAALSAGYDVKVSEIHGMAQRGGAVTTVVRIGSQVSTMVADIGTVDCLVSFETTEALRNIAFLRKDGYLLVADKTIKPVTVTSGRGCMPSGVHEKLEAVHAVLIPAHALSIEAGNSKCENVVILGALESNLGFGLDVWKKAIIDSVPKKTIDENIKAFELGYEFAH